MSWYLFNNSPQRQYRGKKVDGFQNNQRTKLIMDWGLGQLSPQKQPIFIKGQINNNKLNHYNEINSINKKTIQKPQRTSKSQHLQQGGNINQKTQKINSVNKINKINKQSKADKLFQLNKVRQSNKPLAKVNKAKIIEQTVKILTQSSDEQGKQQLIRVLKNYQNKHKQNKQYNNQYENNQYNNQLNLNDNEYNNDNNYDGRKQEQQYPIAGQYNRNNYNYNNNNNKSLNVLSAFQFQPDNKNIKNKQSLIDLQTAKRMRFLQNSLLPQHKRDNMSAILDFNLNSKISQSQINHNMTDSRVSGKSHFANKKNQSNLQLGDGYNNFIPIKDKVKDMNQKLKEMYNYDQWCKKRQVSQIGFG